MMTWWADYLDANREEHITPYEFAHKVGADETRALGAVGT
ncbi:hypothetical protein PS934_00126 [Pseudomonas fluorescens]|nr:hypothetical protein PS934_00126 [Pseudomonas fluorescens]